MKFYGNVGKRGTGMGMRGAIIAAVMGISLTGAGTAFAAACYTPDEARASQVRQFQSELMVAALKCGTYNETRSKYNVFARKFQGNMAENARVLRRHFARNYGAQQSRQMDSFITQLANGASMKTARIDGYCGQIGAVFDQVLTLDRTQFEDFAVTHVVSAPVKVASTPRLCTKQVAQSDN